MEKRSIREGIGDSLRQRNAAGKPRESRTSRAYRRYFQDYVEIPAVQSDGKVKIQRTYVGKYYQQEIPVWKRIIVRIGYIALMATAFGLYFRSGLADLPCNRVWYVTLFQAISVSCMIYAIVGLGEYLVSFGRLTIGEYRSVTKKMRRAPYCAAAAVWLTMIASAGSFLLAPQERPESWMWFLLDYLLAGGLLMLIPTVDRRIPYSVSPSEGALMNPKQEDEES